MVCSGTAKCNYPSGEEEGDNRCSFLLMHGRASAYFFKDKASEPPVGHPGGVLSPDDHTHHLLPPLRTPAAMDDTPTPAAPHFVLVPFFAPGHMIPMLDIAHLLAERRRATVSFVTTPLNAARVRDTIQRAGASGLPIRFVELPFPCAELSLPEGCESLELAPSLDAGVSFFRGLSVLRAPLAAYLRDQLPPTSCIVSDMCHPWTRGLAEELGVPRLVFHGTSCFALLCNRNIEEHKLSDNPDDETKPFLVPAVPDRIEITKEQAPGFFRASGTEDIRRELDESEKTCDGVLLNSFYGLESSYIDGHREATGKKIWAIGPVSLYNNGGVTDRGGRGNNTAGDGGRRCLSWLDTMKPGSVVFVNFGSLTTITPPQIIEIGKGLEASGHAFVWVIKAAEQSPAVETWLLEEEGGFEARLQERSFVLRGWAPQVAILSHPAVGGFVSHCGWNSSLEAIAAGVPLVTWPCFADQFLNERLIVDVLRVGVPVGAKKPTRWRMEELGEVVRRTAVEEAVRKLMDAGEEGRERRERARLLGEKARAAMAVGGSSYQDMDRLISEICAHIY